MKLSSGQYYGDIFQSTNANGIILTKSDYEHNSSIPKHYHNNPYFCYVLDGHYTEHFFQNIITCTKGDIIFHPKETEHYNLFKHTAVSCFNIEFSGQWQEKFFDSPIGQNKIVSQALPELQMLTRKIYNEFMGIDNLSSLMIEGLTTEMMILFKRESKQQIASPYYLNKVISFIKENYHQKITLSELADYIKVSPEYLVRVFKKSFHCTIGEYIRQVRIKHACKLLNQTDYEIVEVAKATGFLDKSHFTRVFKRITGTTPLTFKKN